MSSFGSRPTGAIVFVLAVAFAATGLSSLAAADDLPLVLTNENIGMSNEEIEAARAPAPEPARCLGHRRPVRRVRRSRAASAAAPSPADFRNPRRSIIPLSPCAEIVALGQLPAGMTRTREEV